MRDDIYRVVLSRPRHREWVRRIPKGSQRQEQRLARENLTPARRSLIARWSWPASQSDHLAPVYRFLLKSVGRPWDQVFSEICHACDLRSHIQNHVIDHILQWVCRKPMRTTQGIADETGSSLLERSWYHFYVDPDSGCLVETPSERKIRRVDAPCKIVLGPLTQYRKIHGLWYHVTFEEYNGLVPYTRDALSKSRGEKFLETARYGLLRKFLIAEYGSAIIAVKKRQVGKKELKRVHQLLPKMSEKSA